MGTDYIAKGFNFLKKKKKSPQIPLTLTEAEQCGERGRGSFPKGTDLFPTSPPARQSATRTQLFSSAFKNNHNHKPLQNVTHALHHRPHPPSQQCGTRGVRERAKGTTFKSRSPFLPGRQGACNYTHALHDALPTRMSRPSCAPGTHGHGAGGGAIGEE